MCDTLKREWADALTAMGLLVPDRQENDTLEKAIGYRLVRSPAAIALPLQKWVWLYDGLRYMVAQREVNTGQLHSVVAV